MAGQRDDWLALLEALERGDRVALVRVTQLITNYLVRFRAYGFRDSWDDVTQNVLIALIRSRQRGALLEPGAFVSYAGTITRNELATWIRKNKRHDGSHQLEDLQGELERGLGAPEQRRDKRPDLRNDLARALDGLQEKDRQVLSAIYLERQTYEQASKSLGMPLGTLKRRQTQGLREVRQRMGVDSS
jgi:RNA polymerase sigma-70 factor (ECF subfamily)